MFLLPIKVRIALLLVGIVIIGGVLLRHYGHLPNNQIAIIFSVPYIEIFGCLLMFVGIAATGQDHERVKGFYEDPTPGFGAKKHSPFSDWFSGEGSGGGGSDSSGGDGGGGGGGE